jgi:hypothetical protein
MAHPVPTATGLTEQDHLALTATERPSPRIEEDSFAMEDSFDVVTGDSVLVPLVVDGTVAFGLVGSSVEDAN